MSLTLTLSSCLSVCKHHGKRQVVLKVVCLLFLISFGVIQKPICSVGPCGISVGKNYSDQFHGLGKQ